MNFKEFRLNIMEQMKVYLGENVELSEHDVQRINDIVEHGISIRKENCKMAPVIYVDDFYQSYMDGEMVVDEVVEALLGILNRVETEDTFSKNIPDLQEWESVKSLIKPKLINTEQNRVLLENLPHKDFLNLSIVFYAEVHAENECFGSLTITNDIMNRYDQSVESLYEQALENLKLEEICMVNIGEAIGMPEVCCLEQFVLSNESKVFGAATIISEEVRKMVADKFGGEVFVLPSSINEVILVKKGMMDNPEMLKQIVMEINSTEVDAQEVLADNVYLLDKSGELHIAA